MSERELILGLIRLGSGHIVDMFSMLYVMQMEDGDFGVYYDKCGDPLQIQEWLFTDVEKAVDFFLAKRTELELGYEFEVEPSDDTGFYKTKAGA